MDSGRLFSIPLIRNSETPTGSNSCGIHNIAVSPASHYVSTCGQNPNEVAVYRHHTLDPLILGRVCCFVLLCVSVAIDCGFSVYSGIKIGFFLVAGLTHHVWLQVP